MSGNSRLGERLALTGSGELAGYTQGTDPAGRVACGTTDEDSTVYAVAWTETAKRKAGVVTGSDMSSLYQWWKTKS